MSVASLDDLKAIGAIHVNADPGDERVAQAELLLPRAEAKALDWLGIDEAAVAALPATRQLALATTIAEIAGRRLQSAAAPNVDPLMGGVPPAGPMTLKLTQMDKDALGDWVAGGRRHSASVEVERDGPSSWTGYPEG